MKYLHSPLTFVFCCLLVIGANAQPATKVGAICITVNKMDVSLPFYTKVLGFEHLSSEAFLGKDHENLMNNFGIHYEVAHLKLGDEYVDLVDYLTAGGRSIPETQKSNDLSFQHIAIVVSDMPKAYKLLKEKNVNFVSTEPQTIPISNPAAAGIKAFYFQDPDRHTLELIFFPAGKGKTKWHEKTSRLFLGIDHTAIGISNTMQSETFWRDLLQLQKKVKVITMERNRLISTT